MYVYIVFFLYSHKRSKEKRKKQNKNSDISKETLDISEETVVNKHFFFNTPPPLPLHSTYLPLHPTPNLPLHSTSPSLCDTLVWVELQESTEE